MESSPAKRPPTQRGILARALSIIFALIAWLLASLVFSIVIEWVGMTFWWNDEGTAHSRQLLVNDLRYLESAIGRSVLTVTPAMYAECFSDYRTDAVLKATGINRLITWIGNPSVSSDRKLKATISKASQHISDYLVAMVQSTQVFVVRVAILVLALPLFVLLGMVGLVDGLVQRDLRRWGGGRESSFVYHLTKKAMFPLVCTTWLVYLAMPCSIHPMSVIFPCAVVTAIIIATTAGKFKKYL